MRYTILITSILFLISCSVLKVEKSESNIIYKNKIKNLNSELSVVLLESNTLNCNTKNIIDLRLDGQSSRNLLFNSKGCVLTKEGMYWGLTPVCNKNTKIHSITILLKEEDGNLKEVVTINLDDRL